MLNGAVQMAGGCGKTCRLLRKWSLESISTCTGLPRR